MSQTAVHEALDRIKRLSALERAQLDELLVHEEEEAWRTEAGAARRSAGEKGIDQEAIDGAVRAMRHGE
jgi:hypothetical protein